MRSSELVNMSVNLAISARERGRAEGRAAAAGMSIPPAMVDDIAALAMARQIADLERRHGLAPEGSEIKSRLARELERAMRFQDGLTEKRMRAAEAESARRAAIDAMRAGFSDAAD
jgi:hypothetical protein